MAPFLDQSIELTNQGHKNNQALNNLKGITSKHLNTADRNQGSDLTDAIRPKTSTGLRGSGIYSKMNTIDELN